MLKLGPSGGSRCVYRELAQRIDSRRMAGFTIVRVAGGTADVVDVTGAKSEAWALSLAEHPLTRSKGRLQGGPETRDGGRLNPSLPPVAVHQGSIDKSGSRPIGLGGQPQVYSACLRGR